MKKMPPRPPKKAGIKFQQGWLEGEKDMLVLYRNVPGCDRALVMHHMTSKVMRFNYETGDPYFEDSFVEELEKRGYDISTLRFSIDKKLEAENEN